jgi:Asp/Glu/hydantoin racemase
MTTVTTATAPRIALIHAVYAAMAPAAAAFAALWPEARCVNLVDDALPADLEAAGSLTPALHARIARLAQHAVADGAEGILYTCSAFGPAIEAAAAETRVPVLKPNEAMFETALDIVQRTGARMALLGTFPPALAAMAEEFAAMAQGRGLKPELVSRCVPAAMQAHRSGDTATHNGLLAEAMADLAGFDVVMLAHFSTATALDAVRAVHAGSVLTAPAAAVAALKRRTAALAEPRATALQAPRPGLTAA